MIRSGEGMLLSKEFSSGEMTRVIKFSRLVGKEVVSVEKRLLKPFRKWFRIWLDSEIQEPFSALMESILFLLLWIIVDTFTGTIIKWSTDKKSNHGEAVHFLFFRMELNSTKKTKVNMTRIYFG